MARFRQPWFRGSRGVWYVELNGKQVNLGPDRQQAFKKYHQLMRDPPPTICANAVVAIIDAFLDWVHLHRSPQTYTWYKDRLQSFTDSIDRHLALTELKPFHVQKWMDGRADLAPGSRRNMCRAVQRAMRWAVQQGYIPSSPIAYMEKPPQGKREQIVSEDEYGRLLELTSDQNFRDLLTVVWETGARPQETLRVEARHVDIEHARWVFPQAEAKGGKVPRVVYLPPKALEITKRLMKEHPAGRLFRNTEGVAWTPDACNCRFRNLEKKTGTKYCLYALRHSWMNRMLMSGCDALTVAILAGHCDPSTLAKTYQHLSQSPDYLRSAAMRLSA